LIKRIDQPTYTTDPEKYGRFDERYTVFMRLLWDKKASFFGHDYRENIPEIIARNYPEYSRLEFARILAAWTVHEQFSEAFSWKRVFQADPNMLKLGKHPVQSPTLMSEQIKETARTYGADLVGICQVDHRWIYSHDRSGDPIEIPVEYKYAIVIGIAMDKEAISASPAFRSATASGVGYSRMAFTAACLAEFIRNLRYKAISMGNDTALSIPLAIDAGLGQLGRNGLLVTPEYGPCVRLCKILTDLPLEPDRPIDFGLTKFCKACYECAEVCKVQAISSDVEPSFKLACPSNNTGVLRWAVNVDKCYEFWMENGAACSSCVAVCPFTQQNGSSHSG